MNLADIPTAYTYDDLLLVPQHSDLNSRSEADTSTSLFGRNFRIPIITANMESISAFNMAAAMGELGGLGILHRYARPEFILRWIEQLVARGMPAVASVGVKPEDYDLALAYIDGGAEAVTVDIAHGDSQHLLDMVERLAKVTKVIAGNVATGLGARRLVNVGASVVKVGVGSSQICSTRLVSGHGVPQASAVNEVYNALKNYGVKIIADGGIRTSGDIVKSLALGADAVMIGGLVSGCNECPGETEEERTRYSGMASEHVQLKQKGKVSNSAPEGISIRVKAKGPVKNVIDGLVGGIRSGLSYSGARNLSQLRDYAEFVKITSAGLYESRTAHENSP